MKIAFIVGVFPSLSETFILNQITGLIDLGHEVEIFSKDRSTDKKSHIHIEQYNLLNKVRFFPEIPQNKLWRIFKGKILFLKNFSRDPVRLCKSINIFNRDKDILSLKVLYYLIPFAGKKFDIIYSHFGHNGIIGVYLKKAGISSKFVTTFHGYDLSVFLHLNGKSVYSQLFKYTDLCLPISKYWEQMLKELGCPSEKIKIHRMGISIEKNVGEENQKNREILKILTVGRLVDKKGHRYSIQAVSELLDEGEKLEYTIAGGGPLLSDMKKYVQKLGHEEKIRFQGESTNSEVMEFYDQSDALILHSITPDDQDKEGIPVVLMEAMMKGLPVISTFHSGIPELVKNGESGFLVKEKDTAGMKNAIKSLIKDRALCGSMGREGRKIVSEEYNIEIQNKKIEKIFSELYTANPDK